MIGGKHGKAQEALAQIIRALKPLRPGLGVGQGGQ